MFAVVGSFFPSSLFSPADAVSQRRNINRNKARTARTNGIRGQREDVGGRGLVAVKKKKKRRPEMMRKAD